MAKLSRDLSAGTLHPRELITGSGTLATAGSEVIIACDGCASVTLDLRGSFALSIEVAGTVDGSNWVAIPVRVFTHGSASPAYMVATPASQAGVYVGSCLGFRQVRTRCAAYTSGSATVVLAASIAALDQSLAGQVSPLAATNTGASGTAVTLTLGSPGIGLRHYLTQLEITRSAAAALTAGAAPTVVTTTNLPGTLAFTFGADAAAQGVDKMVLRDFAYPLAASAQNAATTVVCPATTGVIWRVSALFYVAP